jgi:hypothetical protein
MGDRWNRVSRSVFRVVSYDKDAYTLPMVYLGSMRVSPLLVMSLCVAASAHAQTPASRCQNGRDPVRSVSCLIPTLFFDPNAVVPPAEPDPRGIQLRGAGDHTPHFTDLATPSQDYSQNFLPLNSAIATQLALLPIPSPASGFVFSYDRAAGLSVPNPRTLGPILTERAETIGRGKISFGTAYQRFRFSTLDDQNLNNLPLLFQHTPGTPTTPATTFANADYITGQTSIDLKIDQFIFFGSAGLTDWLDVSVAIPLNDVRLSASAPVQIQRVPNVPNAALGINQCGGGTRPCHFFGTNENQLTNSYSANQSATGLGDVTLRFKGSLHRPEPGKNGVSIALLTDVRLPSGDEQNFLGSGAWGVRPFLAMSFGTAELSPHVNIGYQINGNSSLASNNLAPGASAHLPNQFFYSFGTDVSIVKDKVTAAGDIMGSRLFNAPRLLGNQTTIAGNAVPRIGFGLDSFAMNNASMGVKVALYKQLLLMVNVLVRLDNNGLRQRATPLIGLTFTP